jgi:hypothetical protein
LARDAHVADVRTWLRGDRTADFRDIQRLETRRRPTAFGGKIHLHGIAPVQHVERPSQSALQACTGILGDGAIQDLQPGPQFGEKLLLALGKRQESLPQVVGDATTASEPLTTSGRHDDDVGSGSLPAR